MIGIDIGSCNGDPRTCPARAQIIECDTFYAAVGDVDPLAANTRELLGHLAASCDEGTCPGLHPETTKAVLRKIIGELGDGV
jgi:hypothetical protein